MTVEVHLWSGLRRLTDGASVVPVEAKTVGEALAALKVAHPGLVPVLDAGVSVSINGVIAAGNFDPIPQGAEVWLMQRIKGG